jgi:hypothetical protein
MPGVVNPGRPDSDIDVIRGALTQEGAERTTRCFGGGPDQAVSKALTQGQVERFEPMEVTLGDI